ncbi:MAG: site-specific integrase [Anaerolineales bacterium]|nr:site-specific integrase [Anaerolineales bacterium]MCL4257439.1 site-specific integrase [Anaerolineales bacterium]
MPKAPVAPPLSSKITLPPAIQAWASFLQDQGSSVHTVKAFTGDIRLLASFLPADQAVGTITTNDLNNFLDWMQHKRGVECSPKTLSRRITSLKGFFRWLQSGGAVLADPAERVVQRSVLSPLPDVLSEDEMDKVLAVAARQRRGKKGDARAYTLLSLLLSTGIKKGETLALKTNHVDLEAADGPTLFVRYPSPKDRYKERKISLPAEWVEAYEEYRTQYDLSDALFPWSPRRLEYLLEDLGKEAGLEQQLSFLMCRWSCALRDLRSGMDENHLRQKLGVSEIQWRELSMKLSRLRAEDQLQMF